MRLRIKGTTTNLKFLFQNYSLKFGGKKVKDERWLLLKVQLKDTLSLPMMDCRRVRIFVVHEFPSRHQNQLLLGESLLGCL